MSSSPPPARIATPILVTGATGFIGRRLVRRLLDDGYAPRLFVRPTAVAPEGDRLLAPEDARWTDLPFVVGDVAEVDTVHRAVRDTATVFHLAAKVGDWGRRADHRAVTVRGTEHVLGEAARREARVILASSVVVYGEQLGAVTCDEQRPLGREAYGPYGDAKRAAERVARNLEAERGLRVTVVRPTNVYGPGSKPWVDAPVEAMRQGLPALIGDGRRDAGLAYVDNVVDVFVRAAATPAAVGRTYNANDECGVTWREYFTDLARLVGARCPPRSLPMPAARLLAPTARTLWDLLRREDRAPLTPEALHLLAADHRVPSARARRELGHRPEVSYTKGMAAVARYLGAPRAQVRSA
ncbi:MAG: NAD-dependent epimerase/dehydratase family protein [Myxococcota bacterium]